MFIDRGIGQTVNILRVVGVSLHVLRGRYEKNLAREIWNKTVLLVGIGNIDIDLRFSTWRNNVIGSSIAKFSPRGRSV